MLWKAPNILWDKFVDLLAFITKNVLDKGFAEKKSVYFF